MDNDTPPDDFVEWLKHNKLQAYQQALEDEGFEELESLALLNDEQLEDLSSAIQMKRRYRYLSCTRSYYFLGQALCQGVGHMTLREHMSELS